MTPTPKISLLINLTVEEYKKVEDLAWKHHTSKVDILRRALQALILAEGGLE